MTRVRRLPGRFLGPTGLRYSPLRDLPVIADEKDLVDRIKAATTLRDEPECIGPAILGDWSEVKRLEQSQQHALDVANARQARPLLEVDDRIRDIERRAKYARVDMTNEVHLMRRDVDRARAGNRKPPKRVLDRCEGLEGLLDGIAA